MTIHHVDPFATPEPQRSPVRRLRGRFAAPVALWTAGAADAPGQAGYAGLTVSSTLVADGEPGLLLGLVDDESELWEAIEATGRFAVAPLVAGEQQLADRFAGIAPAPGGLFAQPGDDWHDSGYGPVPAGDRSWAGCTLAQARPCGWGLLVEGVIERVRVADDEPAEPLTHYRGRYRERPR